MTCGHLSRRLLRQTAVTANMLVVVLAAMAAVADPIEPGAGGWRTWVIGSAAELRREPPPGQAATQAELEELRRLAQGRDGSARARVAYWDAGGPSYRWNQLAVQESLRRGQVAMPVARQLALLNAALQDAVIATWDSKYAHNRPRPASEDPTFATVLPTPDSPSYPSEHAAAAGAAAEVLAYLFPDAAERFRRMAEEAANSRLLAGVHYRSDIDAGLALGREVGARAVALGRADGSDAPWSGSVPTGPGLWQGANPLFPQAARWRTWVLARPGELRPPPPPTHDSAETRAELAELRGVQRRPAMTATAWYWEHGAGGFRSFAVYADLVARQIFESRLDTNPPRSAQVYAIASIAFNDAMVACWDAKYTYWRIRPSQLDPELRSLFPPPPHPSYPAAHGCFTTAVSTALARLFPHDAEALEAIGAEAAEARIWAGIHYRSDVIAGREIGREVAARVVAAAGAAPR